MRPEVYAVIIIFNYHHGILKSLKTEYLKKQKCNVRTVPKKEMKIPTKEG